MRAATFDWLNTVDELEVNGDTLRFTLSTVNNYGECEYVAGEIELGTKTVEAYDSMNPENGHDIEVPALKSKLCKVWDFDNVYAIEGQPFELTPCQFRILGEYLDEFDTLAVRF